jgi:hypothetical protein
MNSIQYDFRPENFQLSDPNQYDLADLKAEEMIALPIKDDALARGTLVEVEGLGVGTVVELPLKPWEDRTLFLVQVGELKSRVQKRLMKQPSSQKAKAFGAYQASQKRLESRRSKWNGDPDYGS